MDFLIEVCDHTNMDFKTYKECLQLVGKIVVQYKLPAGDPCWISKEICSYVGSHLDDTIIKYRDIRKKHTEAVNMWQALIKPYASSPVQQRVKLFSEPLYIKVVTVINQELDTYDLESKKLYHMIAKYHTPNNRRDIDRRCYN